MCRPAPNNKNDQVRGARHKAGPMGRWGHSATMITESQMLVLGGQADDDAHQATLGDLYKFNFGEWHEPEIFKSNAEKVKWIMEGFGIDRCLLNWHMAGISKRSTRFRKVCSDVSASMK